MRTIPRGVLYAETAVHKATELAPIDLVLSNPQTSLLLERAEHVDLDGAPACVMTRPEKLMDEAVPRMH